MRASTTLLCVAAMTAGQSAYPELSSMPLEELIRSSDQIVIATVTRVTESNIKSRTVLHATATIKKTLKGPQLRSLEFDAFPAGPETMDSTEEANEGETILLFLYKQNKGTFGIQLFGRGRMPLRELGGKTYATLWSPEIILPADAPTIPGPDPRYSFIVSVDLDYLEQQIAQVTDERPSGAL